MIDPESLDPFEVLAHLNQLGYQNIRAPQLKEFMQDLKKLIKYEQKYPKSFGLENVAVGESSVYSSVNSCYFDKSGNESNSNTDSSQDLNSTENSELCSNCNASDSERTCEISCVTSNISDVNDTDRKEKKLSMRPQSSFIRPWRLQSTFKGNSVKTSLKNDPVQLYHKYKELWDMQKVPGENSHSQLRWTIREKMLGQDPHPRPISQVSSDCRLRSISSK